MSVQLLFEFCRDDYVLPDLVQPWRLQPVQQQRRRLRVRRKRHAFMPQLGCSAPERRALSRETSTALILADVVVRRFWGQRMECARRERGISLCVSRRCLLGD